jgi:hypothetical protein
VDTLSNTWGVTQANGRKGHRTVRCAPDSVRCANGRLRQTRKEIRTGQCPVVHRTVWCTRRQKARIAFLECTQQAPSCLGAIKGTPRRMEEYTKHSLSIPKHQDFDSVHLILCDSN